MHWKAGCQKFGNRNAQSCILSFLEQLAVSSEIFEARSGGLSNVVGAIDGCHIPIKQPVGNATDYYNRKQVNSVVLQGVCNQKMKFIDIFIGMPGRMHDARVFRNSPLYKNLTENNTLLTSCQQHIIGDCAYPLMINLMTPFRNNGNLSRAQERYNTKLSSIRSVIERAFRLLKTKFRRLKYIDTRSPVTANNIIAASCVLHNILIDSGEDIEEISEDSEIINSEEMTQTLLTTKRLEIVNNL